MERQRLAAEARETELVDKILSMKGYREFNPVISSAIQPITEWEEESVLKDEGFQPY